MKLWCQECPYSKCITFFAYMYIRDQVLTWYIHWSWVHILIIGYVCQFVHYMYICGLLLVGADWIYQIMFTCLWHGVVCNSICICIVSRYSSLANRSIDFVFHWFILSSACELLKNSWIIINFLMISKIKCLQALYGSWEQNSCERTGGEGI